MKTHEEIGKEAARDWAFSYYNVRLPDESNMGDVAEWAIREYIRELLGLHSCHFCYKWFESVDKLCDHLSTKHNTKIVIEPRASRYSDYSNTYYKDSRIVQSLSVEAEAEQAQLEAEGIEAARAEYEAREEESAEHQREAEG